MGEERKMKRLDGKLLSSEIKEKLKADIEETRKQHPDFTPGLAIVQVGNREDSTVYVGTKCKTAKELGMSAVHVKLPPTVTQSEVLEEIDKLNKDPKVHGIIVQLPLDCETEIDTAACTNAVLPSKDVDGLHDINAGRLSRGELSRCFVPCTPRGCMLLIKHAGMDVCGKTAVVIGRSKIVGSPMANLLTWANATVTICHSRTTNLEEVVRKADVVVAACGKTELVKGSWIKPGAVVIDCGINVLPDPTKKSGRRLVGDVEYKEAIHNASRITPVPGGVGPMTVAMLLQNTVESCKKTLKDTANEEK